MTRDTITIPRAATRALALLPIFALGACGSFHAGDPAQVVHPSDFSTAPAPRGPAPSGQSGLVALDLNGKVRVVQDVSAIVASGGVDDVAVHVGPPDIAVGAPTPVGRPVLIEAIVGTINGKPVRASEFFEPIGDRLQAAARRPDVPRNQWIAAAGELIRARLVTEIESEMLVNAGAAELSPAEKEGFENWLMDFRRRVVARGGGSVESTERRLRDEYNASLSDILDEQRKVVLVQRIRARHIEPRVQVSKRDMQAFYDQNFDQFNKPPVFAFRRISVDTANSDAVIAIAAGLAAGKPFAEVAATFFNEFNPDDGGRWESESDRPQAESSFFNAPELNDAARTLLPGRFAGPLQVRSSTEWLFLDAITIRAKSFYDAQLEIETILRTERLQVEQDRFLRRLLDQGSHTSIEEMSKRLLEIAIQRFLGPAPANEPTAPAANAAPSE